MSWQGASGLKAWLVQRVSAIYIAVFLIISIANLLIKPPATFNDWIARIAHPVTNIAIALFILALLAHAWVGGRDVLMDYVKPTLLRATLLSLLLLSLFAMGLWAIKILFNVIV